MSKKKHLVVFEPFGRKGSVEEGKTLMEAARELGVSLDGVCGGQGKCGKCRVEVLEGNNEKYRLNSKMGHLSPMGETERKLLARTSGQTESTVRLACLSHIQGDIVVYVPEGSRAERTVISKSIAGKAVALKPAVRKYYVELKAPTLKEPLGDWDRLQAALSQRFGLETVSYTHLRAHET